MATSGFFTYYDLYAGKPEIYHQHILSLLSLSTTEQPSSTQDTTTTSLPIAIDLESLISSTTTTTTQLSITSNNSKLHQVARWIPFAYFHWFFIGLAVLFALLLIIVFTCYCRTHCRKSRRSRREKKQPLPNFYRYRTGNRRGPSYNIFETSVPISVPSPARPCPQKSVERLNNQLLRQGLEAVGSPQAPRINIGQAKPSSTFSNNASSLLTEIKGRLNTCSTDQTAKNQPLYETQRTNMMLNDESKNDSTLIDMN